MREAFVSCWHYIKMTETTTGDKEEDAVYAYGLQDGSPQSRQCRAVSLVFFGGKTNQMGKTEQAAVFRHRSPFICPVGALGFHFFYLYEMQGVPPPLFDKERSWFTLRSFPDSLDDMTKALSYRKQVVMEELGYKQARVEQKGRAVTHRSRKQVQYAQMKGISKDECADAGRWSQDVMKKAYSRFVSHDFLLVMAGFHKGDTHYIARDILPVPNDLQTSIWPWVDKFLQQIQDARERESEEEGDLDSSIACRCFLLLLRWLRCVILQDAAFLIVEFPSHPLWQHEVFDNDTFRNFAADLRRVVEEAPDPNANRLDVVAPIVSASISSMNNQVAARITNMEIALTKKIEATAETHDSNMRSLHSTVYHGFIHMKNLLEQPMVLQRSMSNVSSEREGYTVDSFEGRSSTMFPPPNLSGAFMHREGDAAPTASGAVLSSFLENPTPSGDSSSSPTVLMTKNYETLKLYAKEWFDGMYISIYLLI